MGQPNEDQGIEFALVREFKKQMSGVVKDFDWSDSIQEFISDVVQEALASKEVKDRVRAAVVKVITSDKEVMASLVSKAILQTSK